MDFINLKNTFEFKNIFQIMDGGDTKRIKKIFLHWYGSDTRKYEGVGKSISLDIFHDTITLSS